MGDGVGLYLCAVAAPFSAKNAKGAKIAKEMLFIFFFLALLAFLAHLALMRSDSGEAFGQAVSYNAPMTTTIGMHYDVLPGKEDEFRRGFEAVQKHLQQAAGHVESKLYVDTQSPGSHLIFSQWKSKEDFERFLRSPEFANVTAWGRAEILRDRPRHKIYQTP